MRFARLVALASLACGSVGLVVGQQAPVSAADGLTLSVTITTQSFAGDVCQEFVNFDAAIQNDTGGPVTVANVDYGSYDQSDAADGGLHGGTILLPGENSFPGNSHGGRYFCCSPCNYDPTQPDNTRRYDPLTLTVTTDVGILVWDECNSDSGFRTYASCPTTTVPAIGRIGSLGFPLAAGAAFTPWYVRSRRRHRGARDPARLG